MPVHVSFIKKMVDSLTGRPRSRRILLENKVEGNKNSHIKRNNRDLLPDCFIKLRPIKLYSNNNNHFSVNIAIQKRVVSKKLKKERGCTKNRETKTSMYLGHKQITRNNRIVQNKKAENFSTPSQKRCKKLMVKLRREDPSKVFREKGQHLSALNEEVARPNTRRIRISYKPKEYKPKCGCGCAIALQDQCVVNESEKPKATTQVKSIKKVVVRLKRIKIENTTRSQANTKLRKVMVKVKRIRHKNNVGNKKNTNEEKGRDVDTEVLEISRFSPIRNSTVFVMGGEALSEVICDDEPQHLIKDTDNGDEDLGSKTSMSKGNQKIKCLTDNPNLIEQILCNDNGDENGPEIHMSDDVCGTTNQATSNTTRAHKFFHRMPATKLPSRKTSVERKKVFEYLSQSDSSESEKGKHMDPAADIINKLIAEGKVRVATNHKGTGRPILKRIRRKQTINKNKKRKINRKKIRTETTFDRPADMKEIVNIGNGNELLPSVPAPQLEYDDDNSSAHYDEPNVEYTNDGGFSNLARSVLLQEARRNEITRKKDVAEQRRLLEVARKFVSTPAAKRQNESILDLSPIHNLSVQRRPACPSPWRIDEDAHLPRVFNFSKNNSYLPTFSSDYIPPSPKKMTPNNNTQFSSCSSHTNSTRSTNDSNVENMPPPVSNSSTNPLNNDENADIFNLRQLPNPRRTLQHRTPLKAINIIEVVNLPPWNIPINYHAEKNKTTNSEKSTTTNSSKNDGIYNAEELFGFEELINEDPSEVEDPLIISNVTTVITQSIKQNLHMKLQNLKKWRPKKTAHDKPSSASVSSSRLFDEDEGRPKQRLIKEMLCSTMINPVNALPAEGNVQGGESLPIAKSNNDQAIEVGDLFNDYEPDKTFNDKQFRRTYARPIRQKRKIRKNVVRFLDSDEYNSSDSDGEEQQKEDRKIKEQKKMRHDAKAKLKNNLELESFVNEFNSMCKEVDSYELIVE